MILFRDVSHDRKALDLAVHFYALENFSNFFEPEGQFLGFFVLLCGRKKIFIAGFVFENSCSNVGAKRLFSFHN